MGVRYLQYFLACIIAAFSLVPSGQAQQIARPQPLITPPGVTPPKHPPNAAYYRGVVPVDIVPMKLQPSVFPLFIEDNEMSSLVTLNNSSGIPSSVVLTIRDPQGATYTPVSIRIGPQAKVQIKVSDLLQKIGARVRTGSILITQGPELKRNSIVGQLTLTEFGSAPMALTEEEMVMPMLVDSQDLRSVSESSTDAQLIAVTSLIAEPQHITAKCFKKGSISTKTAILAPGGTALLYPCSKDSSQFEGISLLGASEVTESAGISIHSDGPNGGFAAFGLARHVSLSTKTKFLGSLQFLDPTALQSSSLVFTGVSAGYSLTPGTHQYSAEVALANFSAQQSHIGLRFYKTDVNGSISTVNKEVVLAPESSLQISLGQLGLKAGEVGSLVVSGDQPPGDLIAKIVSNSDAAPNQLEQLAKDSLSHRNGGVHPWTVQDNTRSDLVLFNHSTRAEPFNVIITTEDGMQWVKQLQLAPYETRTVSINDLIRDKTPDIHGRTIPGTTWSGTVMWHTSGPGIGSGHVLIRSDANSTGENFSCDQVFVVCGAAAFIDTPTLSVGETGQASAEESFCVEWGTVGYCGGDYIYYYDGAAYNAGWSSLDSNVISIVDNSTIGTYQGVAHGSTYLTGTVGDSWGCSASAYTQLITVLDNTPLVTGIDPSDWPADSIPHSVTFTGQYFGNNPPSLTFSDPGITYTLSSYSDTQIVANITVPSGTPDEDVTVGVTNNGYYGNGFVSGGGAVSPTAAVSASVRSGSIPSIRITVKLIGNKSGDDYLSITGDPDECSNDLGLHNCPAGWWWGVEVKATVSDDASNWYEYQGFTGREVLSYFDSSYNFHTVDQALDQPYDGPAFGFFQQPAGQKIIYYVDGPGASKVKDGSTLYSITVVRNFVSTFCTVTPLNSPCRTHKWFVKLVVNPGGILDTRRSIAGLGAIRTDNF